MSKKTALIVIGRFKDEWHTLAPAPQNARQRVERVGRTVGATGRSPLQTPGAFITIWEASSRESVERAIKNLEALARP